MKHRRFTPASACLALARVRPLVLRLRRVYGRMRHRGPTEIACDQPVERGYFALVCQFNATAAELNRLGVCACDPGYVDFPACRAGREVVLCWKLGERGITWWHEPGAGHEARRRLDEDGPWDEATPSRGADGSLC